MNEKQKLEAELEELQNQYKYKVETEDTKQKIEELKSKISVIDNAKKFDSGFLGILKRMGRGFKVMGKGLAKGYSKMANSDYVQNMKAAQESSDSDSMMPEIPKEFKKIGEGVL